jgi:RimJ/RimL family protein N-acetyltransferase
MQWSIRRGTPADAEELARINVAAWQSSYRGIVAATVLDQMRPDGRIPSWRRWLALPDPEAVLVAVDRSGSTGAYCMIGSVRQPTDIHPDLVTGEMLAIYADPARQGQGAGHAAHEAGIRHLAAYGFRYAVLWVLAANTASRRFYADHGWREDGTTHELPLISENVTEIRYGRFLPVAGRPGASANRPVLLRPRRP